MHLVAAIVEPLDRRAVPSRQLVRFGESGCDPVAFGLCQVSSSASPLALIVDPVLLAELRNPLL